MSGIAIRFLLPNGKNIVHVSSHIPRAGDSVNLFGIIYKVSNVTFKYTTEWVDKTSVEVELSLEGERQL